MHRWCQCEGQHVGRAPSRAGKGRSRSQGAAGTAWGRLVSWGPQAHTTQWGEPCPGHTALPGHHPPTAQSRCTENVEINHSLYDALACQITNTDAVIKIMARHFLFSLIRKIGPAFLEQQDACEPCSGAAPTPSWSGPLRASGSQGPLNRQAGGLGCESGGTRQVETALGVAVTTR